MTTRQQCDTISTYYGINPSTLQVESVNLMKNGTLVQFGDGGSGRTHPVMHGRSAKAEVYVVWGLTDVIEIPAILDGSTSARVVIEELEGKAAAMRAANVEHE